MHEIFVQLFHLTIQRKLDGCKGKTEKALYCSIHAAIYTAKASNAAVYTAKASSMLTDRSLSVCVSNFYHCAIYHTGMHSILLCLHLTFISYPLFMGLLRLGSHNMTLGKINRVTKN